MSKYKKLQQEAKELGLPYVGVPREQLEASIKEAKGNNENQETPEPTTKATTEPEEDKAVADKDVPEDKEEDEPEASEKISVSAPVAVVKSGLREVRRYSREVHGPDFKELAEEFANKNGYTISAQ